MNLLEFADFYQLSGDQFRCRACGRPQQVSWREHSFQHRGDCRLRKEAPPHPWVTFFELVADTYRVPFSDSNT